MEEFLKPRNLNQNRVALAMEFRRGASMKIVLQLKRRSREGSLSGPS
jgi:hypothetical protein